MKKSLFLVICLIIIFGFTACSSNNIQQSSSNPVATESYSEKGNQETLLFNGVNYPINLPLDFEVKDVEYGEDEDDNITFVQFCSDDYDKLDDIENYDFSNGYAQFITYIYNCSYNELIEGKGKILGSYKSVHTGKNSNGFDGWQIMYAPDGDIIFKTDIDEQLECGLSKIYYDNHDNIIAKYSGYDKENEKSLFEKADGTIINEDELRTLLESLCPNEYLSGLV